MKTELISFRCISNFEVNLNSESESNKSMSKLKSIKHLKQNTKKSRSFYDKNYLKSTISSSKNVRSVSKSKDKSNERLDSAKRNTLIPSPYFAKGDKIKKSISSKPDRLMIIRREVKTKTKLS